MNQFIKGLFTGTLKRTEDFEKLINAVPEKVKRYHDVEQSDEYKEYCELDALVNSKEFKELKKKYQQTEYKNTEEGKTMTRYKRAAESINVRRYKAVEESDLFKEYFEFKADPLRYAQLKDAEAVKGSSFLRKMKFIDNSLTMRSHRADASSHAMKDYEQLKEVVANPDFQEREAFWKNTKRWETTEEAKKEARYNELKQYEDIRFILKTTKAEIERYERVQRVYFDDFDWINLKDSDWTPGAKYPSKDFQSVHSYTNEVQAFNNGNNTETKDGALVITTRKERVTAPAWDAQRGMVMQDFDYTSDMLNNADKLTVEEGMAVSVKVRCSGILDHGIYLRSDKHIPFISIFDFSGLRLHCGLKSDIKDDSGKVTLDRCFPFTYMIFTVVWGKDEIIWYINNMEVHRCKNEIPKGAKLYLHMYSFAFRSNTRMTEGKMEVDWVSAYKFK